MIIFLLKIFYFMLPAYFANMAPVIFQNNFRSLGVPIDGGRKFRGRSLFGETKTWRGMITGTIMGIVVVWLQQWGYLNVTWLRELSPIDYSAYNFLLLGFLFGFGALFGDLMKSFIKRRIGKGSSESWKIVDQLDFVVGALLFVSLVYFPGWKIALAILILSLILTIIVNQVSYWLKIRKTNW